MIANAGGTVLRSGTERGLDMARINKAILLAEAAATVYRANQVRTDPAVVKAFKQTWDDVVQAARSAAVLVNEVAASWGRSGGMPAAPTRGPRPA